MLDSRRTRPPALEELPRTGSGTLGTPALSPLCSCSRTRRESGVHLRIHRREPARNRDLQKHDPDRHTTVHEHVHDSGDVVVPYRQSPLLWLGNPARGRLEGQPCILQVRLSYRRVPQAVSECFDDANRSEKRQVHPL